MDVEYFNEVLSEEQHQELLAKLSEIINAIPNQDNTDVVEAISSQGLLIKGFIEAVRAIKFPTPQVNVEQIETIVDNSGVVNSVIKVGDDILNGMDGLRKVFEKPKPLHEWEFSVVRNSDGFIKSVTAKQIK